MPVLPTVSVVTPCYNAASTIERCIDAVWQQRAHVLEHVVVDAGSTDGSLELLQGLAASRPDFMVLDSRPDRGISHGFNRGIALAKGDWIGISNADDWYTDNIIKQLRPIMHSGEAILHGRLRQHDPETQSVRDVGKINYRPEKHFTPLRTMPAQHPTCFVPRPVYDRVGGYDENYSVAMDYDFLQRAHLAGVPFVYTSDVVANFTRGGASANAPTVAALEMMTSQMLHQRRVVVPLVRYFMKRVQLARRQLG